MSSFWITNGDALVSTLDGLNRKEGLVGEEVYGSITLSDGVQRTQQQKPEADGGQEMSEAEDTAEDRRGWRSPAVRRCRSEEIAGVVLRSEERRGGDVI
ncbi:hypothetical protein L1887_22689 [Cichorium endivia]|nr:hypothetical protein L1887_22689 [Cichorium endivia]